jgi:hypothetical protein
MPKLSKDKRKAREMYPKRRKRQKVDPPPPTALPPPEALTAPVQLSQEAEDEAKALGLYAAVSRIPGAGTGLFTSRSIAKGARVIEYKGEVLTKTQYQERYPDEKKPPQYMAATQRGYVDAANPALSNYARFANGSHVTLRSGRHKKVATVNTELLGSGWIVSMMAIPENGELIYDYGKDFTILV